MFSLSKSGKRWYNPAEENLRIRYRHSEFISESEEDRKKMLNQVQHDGLKQVQNLFKKRIDQS